MAEQSNNNRHQQLKSTPGPTPKAYAIFKNYSPRVVDILWLDREGDRINYTQVQGGLKRGSLMHMNTYEGHPWIFRDSCTGDKLVFTTSANSEQNEVFFPIPVSQNNPRATDVKIHLPVYTLKERASQVVRNLIKDKSDFEKLEIPTTLRWQLANQEDTVNW